MFFAYIIITGLICAHFAEKKWYNIFIALIVWLLFNIITVIIYLIIPKSESKIKSELEKRIRDEEEIKDKIRNEKIHKDII